MAMCNFIEYSGNYAKTSGSLSQYCLYILPLDNNNAITFFTEANLTD